MNSFYGGKKGLDFQIKEVFPNMVEMVIDLEKRWNSDVGVGDYVVISYGLPNSTDYETNKNADLVKFSKTYNSTFWVKRYIDDEVPTGEVICLEPTRAFGFAYELIASMTGQTPRIDVAPNVEKVKPSQNPRVSVDATNADNPILTFGLPSAWNISATTTTPGDADDAPVVVANEQDGDTKVFTFTLPQAQRFQTEVKVNTVDAGVSPSAAVDETNINRPKLELTLPESPKFVEEVVITPVSSTVGASASVEGTIANPQLHLRWPRTQQYQSIVPITQVATGEQATASVENDGLDNLTLSLRLPRNPEPLAEFEFVGSSDTGEISRTLDAANSQFTDTFKIPQGSRWFTTTSIVDGQPVVVGVPKNGDLCLYSAASGVDTNAGQIWIYQGGVWVSASLSIRGPAGPALNIIANYSISYPITNTIDAVVAEIRTRLGRQHILPNELISIEYLDEYNVSTYYWYFELENQTWGRETLTGGLSGIISNIYVTENADNKVYSAEYLNKQMEYGRISELV